MDNKTRNPLRRRVLRELRDEWRKYAVIFLFLTATIAFVAGMYVANNSMLTETAQARDKYLREDGHFELDAPADAALLAAVETGDMAHVYDYYVQKAHEEIDEKLPAEAEKTLTQQVTDAVTAEAEAAIRAGAEQQAAALGISGEALETLIQTALDENLQPTVDEILPEALAEALDSDEYRDALEEARTTAYAEAETEIDREYDKAVERYELDDPDFQPVPVAVYPLFYRDLDEDADGDGLRDGGVRVYAEPEGVNLYCLMEGRAPETGEELLIDRMHADNSGIQVGDAVTVGGVQFTVCGLAAFSNYSTLYERNTDTMFDALTFNVAMTTQAGYARLSGVEHYCYAWRYPQAPEDDRAEKALSDRFLKALITQAAVSERELEDYVPAYANHAITFAPEDLGSDKAMGGVLLYILVAVLAFIFAITISSTIAREAPVIGTLRASGYTRGELVRHYMAMPILVTLVSAAVGNLLGYTVFKQVVVAMYYNSYSLPAYATIWTPDAFVKTTVVPVLLMLAINLLVLTRKLKLPPLRFLRRDLKTTRRRKAVRLPGWRFFRRFRMRVFLQNLSGYLVLFVGIAFVMLMLAMAVGMPDTLEWYQGRVEDMMLAEHQVILTQTEDEDGNPIETAVPGAERFSTTGLLHRGAGHDEAVTVYGIVENSAYMPLPKSEPGEVWVSTAYQGKFGARAGDVITLEEKYENRSYQLTVAGVCDYDAAVAVFLNNGDFNALFGNDPEDFSGFFSHTPVTDIDSRYVATEITLEDLTRISRQLDHSMGSYMLYFQYLCVLLSAVLIYLLTKLIIERNEGSISMVKILGYTQREIVSLYATTTTIVVIVSELIAAVVGIAVMRVAWQVILAQLDGWFPFVISAGGVVKMLTLVFAGYLLVLVFDLRRIKRIPMDEALKNVE